MSQVSVYREGELVWAKMRGHPHWPAKVSRCPKGVARPQGKLWIFFYGTHEHAWMLPADLYCYEENREKFSLPKKIKGFAEAIWEIEEDPDLVITLGKPPSKRRRQSSQAAGGETPVSLPVPSLSGDITPLQQPSHPPDTSPSMEVGVESTEGQSARREHRRYVTRRQKHSSDGIVAQITQRFAERMELKSPLAKETLSVDNFSDNCPEQSQWCDVAGGRARGEDEEALAGVTAVKSEYVAADEEKGVQVDSHCKEDGERGEGCEMQAAGAGKRRKTQKLARRATRSSGRLANMARHSSSFTAQHEQSAALGDNGPPSSVGECENRPTVEVKGQEEPAVAMVSHGNEVGVPQIDHQTEPAVCEAKEPVIAEINGQSGSVSVEVKVQQVLPVSEIDCEKEEVESTGGGDGLRVQSCTGRGDGLRVQSCTGGGVESNELASAVEAKGQAVEEDVGKPVVGFLSTATSSCDDTTNSIIDSVDGGQSTEQNASTPSDPSADVNDQHSERGEGEPPPRMCVSKSMSTVHALMALNYNLKASLMVQSLDVQEAKGVLCQLLNMQYSAHDLRRVPDLVATIRKVRRFYGNDVVRCRAEEVYTAMKSSFLSSGQSSGLIGSRRGPMRPPMTTSHRVAGGHAPSKTGKGAAAVSPKAQQALSSPDVSNLQPVRNDSCDQTVPSLSPA